MGNTVLRHKMFTKEHIDRLRRVLLVSATSLLLLPSAYSQAQQPEKTDTGSAAAAAAADQIADFFSQVGDQIYEDCIFELSQEQIDVQQALIQAYIKQGADSAVARQLAVKQIQPPKLSAECEQIRRLPRLAAPCTDTMLPAAKKPTVAAAPKLPAESPAPAIVSPTRKACRSGTARPASTTSPSAQRLCGKLTGGEICNPFEDVVREVPASAQFPPRLHDPHRAAFHRFRRPGGERPNDRLGDLRPRRLPKQSRSRLSCGASRRAAAAGRIFLRGEEGATRELGTEDQTQRCRHLADAAVEQGPVQPASKPRPSWRAATLPFTCA